MSDRPRGLGEFGRQRSRDNLGRNTVGGQRVTEYEKQLYGTDRAAPAPPATAWEYPSSSRVRAYSYDFENQQLRVRFHKYNTPWVYNEVPVTVFQAFDAAPSKGMYINSTLNHMSHRRASPIEEASLFID
jgi:hypothetical protein